MENNEEEISSEYLEHTPQAPLEVAINIADSYSIGKPRRVVMRAKIINDKS